jgi:hypothetical protein
VPPFPPSDEEVEMPRTPSERTPGEAPRTDLPPTREPYDDGYFGSEEEEGVVREREARGDEAEESDEERALRGEECAGGDRGP